MGPLSLSCAAAPAVVESLTTLRESGELARRVRAAYLRVLICYLVQSQHNSMCMRLASVHRRI